MILCYEHNSCEDTRYYIVITVLLHGGYFN